MPPRAAMIKFSITGQFIKPFMEFGAGFVPQRFDGKIINVILGASLCDRSRFVLPCCVWLLFDL